MRNDPTKLNLPLEVSFLTRSERIPDRSTFLHQLGNTGLGEGGIQPLLVETEIHEAILGLLVRHV